jgi:hypothetical protein
MYQSKQSLNYRKIIHSSVFVQVTYGFVFIKIQLTSHGMEGGDVNDDLFILMHSRALIA